MTKKHKQLHAEQKNLTKNIVWDIRYIMKTGLRTRVSTVCVRHFWTENIM